MVSVLPLGLYHRLVLQLSQDKLVDTERLQQADLVRSLAQEIQHFESNLTRSEEHTSELQSQSNPVCRLLLEKKKKTPWNATPTSSLIHVKLSSQFPLALWELSLAILQF